MEWCPRLKPSRHIWKSSALKALFLTTSRPHGARTVSKGPSARRRSVEGVTFRRPVCSFILAEIVLNSGSILMHQIAAPTHITTDELDRRAAVPPSWTMTRVLNFLVNEVIRRDEEDAAKLYQGSSWCDSTEYDLNCDIMTGRRKRR